MDYVNDLGFGLLSGAAYAAVGLTLLAVGYVAIDLVTPGRLSTLIYVDRNTNSAAVVGSGLIAIATIVTTAIVVSEDSLGEGLASVAGYGLLGVVLLVLSFLVLDRVTPGDLGAIVCDPERHPAVIVTVTSHLAVGAIVAAAIS